MIRNAFTLIELLIVIVVLALLIALLMPALAGARRAALNVKCLANLGQVARATHAYMAAPPFLRPAQPGALELRDEAWVCPAGGARNLAEPAAANYTWIAPPKDIRRAILVWSNLSDASHLPLREPIAHDPSRLFHGHTNAPYLAGHAARDLKR